MGTMNKLTPETQERARALKFENSSSGFDIVHWQSRVIYTASDTDVNLRINIVIIVDAVVVDDDIIIIIAVLIVVVNVFSYGCCCCFRFVVIIIAVDIDDDFVVVERLSLLSVKVCHDKM